MDLATLHRTLAEHAHWIFVRSSGPGGQNVNKVNSQVQLSVDLNAIEVLSPAEKQRVAGRLGHRMVGSIIQIRSQESRSQRENRDRALERLSLLVLAALTPPRPRKATRPTRGSQERRLEAKRRASDRKQSRNRNDWQ